MKGFRIPLDLAADFERACTLMGMKEQEAARQALAGRIKTNCPGGQRALVIMCPHPDRSSVTGCSRVVQVRRVCTEEWLSLCVDC